MSRRRTITAPSAPALDLLVLSAADGEHLAASLRDVGASVAVLGTVASARDYAPDGVLLDARDLTRAQTLDLCRQLAHLPLVLLSDTSNATLVLEAVRAGAADVRDHSAAPEELLAAFAALHAKGQAGRRVVERLERRNRRLRDVSRALFRSRHELLKNMGELCEQLAGSYRHLSDQMRSVAATSELNAVLRQELDMESLLRTVLEYALKQLGPTNAAIFLPSTTGDYTLGAYVNYDCARESAETLLDHLADVVAPAFEHREDAVVLSSGEQIFAALGRESEWLADATLVARACRHEGECGAVMIFFRDARNPFSPAAIRTIDLIASLFGRQLSRVIKTHHRHLPKDQWSRPGDGSDSDGHCR
ncbi:MAG: hypothetical protein WC718_15990 [Phycisphaerales bacterium]|jgi:DNA-binding NarL/FixJ family response regulator